MRNWFYQKNSSYRKKGTFSLDAEDHQRFQKKIIVLLMTVDAVEGATAKLRLAKKLMIQELEMMLDKADKFIYTKMKINAVSNATEMAGRGAMLLRLAFGRRLPEENQKRRKEMSPHEAATLMARRFREYQVRKENAVKAHEEVAAVEAKMELVRGLCKKNFDDDEEERRRVAEKIIVMLLALLDIEGANLQDRSWQSAMTNELEAMLEIVDPRPVDSQPNLPKVFQKIEDHL